MVGPTDVVPPRTCRTGAPELFSGLLAHFFVVRHYLHGVHRAEEGAALLAGVLDLLTGQLRAADGARSGDGVVEGALFEVHAGTVSRTRRRVSAIKPAVKPVTAISQ
jgi:hypothetical protein